MLDRPFVRTSLLVGLALGLIAAAGASAARGAEPAGGGAAPKASKNEVSIETVEVVSEGDGGGVPGVTVGCTRSGQAVIVDAGADGRGPLRWAPLGVQLLPFIEQDCLLPSYMEQPIIYKSVLRGFTPPIGSNKGSIVASAGGRDWAAVPAADGLRLYDLGDVDAPGALAPRLAATLPDADAFAPGHAPAGIIAILIGLMEEEGIYF